MDAPAARPQLMTISLFLILTLLFADAPIFGAPLLAATVIISYGIWSRDFASTSREVILTDDGEMP